jgi:hypothetical protein
MPTQIAIICTINELRPYSLAAAASNPPVRYFSLNLSIALTGDAGGAPVDAIFQPWLWGSNNITLNAYADNGATGSAPNGNAVTATLLPPSATTLATGSRDAIIARLNWTYTHPPADPNYFYWADKPGAQQDVPSGQNWSRLLAHASTYTAPIPHSLNLTFLFTVPVASLTGMSRLFVAPAFTVGGTTYDVATGTAPVIAPTPATDTFLWTYANPPAGYGMAVYQPEYMFPAPVVAGTGFINLDNYWVATENGLAPAGPPPESVASEDWRTSLESRAAEAFDLPQRVLIVLRTMYFPPAGGPAAPAFPTWADLANIRDGILAAMRDSADFGLRYAPDGTTLFRYVCERQDVTPATYESQLANADVTDIPTWKQLLANTFNFVHLNDDLSALSAPQQMQTTLNMLDSVRAVLAQDDNLATVIFAQWDKNLKGNASWANDGLNLSAELQSLSSSHALRSRMLLANLGGADAKLAIWNALINMQSNPLAPVASGYNAETTAVSNNFQTLLPAYFRGRLLNSAVSPDTLFGSRLPQAHWPATPDLSAALQADASHASLTPDSSNQPTRLPQPLIVQVDNTSEPAADLNDPLRQISGFGLLIQEQTANAYWTSAVATNVYALNNSPPALPADQYLKCLDGVMVPVRASKRNNLKQAVLIYNNASLIGQNSISGTGEADPASTDLNPNGNVYPQSANQSNWQQLFQFRLDPSVSPIQVGTNGSLQIPPFVAADGSDWKRLPALKVGKSYNLLPFVIGAGGALPVELASLHDPITPKIPSLFTPPAAAGYIRTITHKRRVAVGALRLRSSGPTPSIQDLLPSFPASVVPLARDLNHESSSVTAGSTSGNQTRTTPVLLLWNPTTPSFNFQLRPPACDPETWDRWVAGLPEHQPSGPSDTQSFRNTRISVATAIRHWGTKNTAGFAAGKGPDLSLDDPAVTGIVFHMDRIYPSPVQGADVQINFAPLSPIPATIPATDAPTLMAPAQTGNVKVSCSIGSTSACTSPDGVSVTITVAKGDVCRLRVTPLVPDLATKFEGLAQVTGGGPFELWIEAADEGVFAVNPTVAAARQQFQETLWNNLAVSANGDLTAGLNFFASDGITPALTNPHQIRDLVRNVDLRRQAWRWMGRGITPLPNNWGPGGAIDADPAGTADNPNSTLWEVGSFGERRDDDSAMNQAVVNFTGPLVAGISPNSGAPAGGTAVVITGSGFASATSVNFGATPASTMTVVSDSQITTTSPAGAGAVDVTVTTPSGASGTSPADQFNYSAAPVPANPQGPRTVLFSSDLSADPRAQYYRFGIDAHSRYEGLPGFAITSLTAQHTFVDPSDPSKQPRHAFTQWRRCVAPPQVQPPIPKPKILLVLPLTQPAEPDADGPYPTPELLVVANEPWFQIGGLAEELRAEIALARDPTIPLTVADADANPIPELGPNPILSALAQNDAHLTYSSTAAAAYPVGTTFDLGPSALYNSTCFRLSPSALQWTGNNGGYLQGQGLEHFEVKIRFRRTINGQAFGDNTLLESDLTDAFLAEFQPSFLHCNVRNSNGAVSTVAISNLQFSAAAITGNQTALTFWYQGGQVTLEPGPPNTPLFDLSQPRLKLWAVLIQQVTDVTGAPTIRALDIFAQDDDNPLQFVAPSAITGSSDGLSAYLIEVLDSNPASQSGTPFRGGINGAAQLLFPGASEPLATGQSPDTALRINRCSRGDISAK